MRRVEDGYNGNCIGVEELMLGYDKIDMGRGWRWDRSWVMVRSYGDMIVLWY